MEEVIEEVLSNCPHEYGRGQIEALARITETCKSAKDLKVELDKFGFDQVDANELYNNIDEFERSFYGVDEDAPQFIGNEKKWAETEEVQARHTLESRLRQQNRLNDQSIWEDSLLYRSGAKTGRTFSMTQHDEQEEQVNITVHNIRPAFLETSDTVFSLSSGPATISVVKDEKSDMAQASIKGSATVNRMREQNVRTKMQNRYWELGSSRMGEALGLAQKEEPADEDQIQREYLDEALEENEKLEADKMQKVRQNLPIYQVRNELLTVIRNNQVVVIVGETGSGKTTQLTQYLMEDGYPDIIGCTQPRRVAAMSVAKRVAEEANCVLGTKVGYTIRFEDKSSKETKIKYMTDGILLRETLGQLDLDKYSCIVMDEAHERALNTDVLFGILKGVVIRRLDFRLIVTSATMDADKFSRFFGGCATFHIPGRTYKVNNYFAKATVLDYVDATVKQALQIHLASPPGDILIFMTGQEDITATCQLLASRIEQMTNVPELLLLPMYSQLPSDLQEKIFHSAKRGQRKCVVSTNIAETSLTVDGIRYVIDAGFCKIKVFNPRVGMDALRIVPVSHANANQRSGRAGRTAEGFCWRMFTEHQYVREMMPAQLPEIQRTNLGTVVLLLKSLGVDNLLDFDFMDPPPRENIVNSMYQLWVLGALNDDGKLSDLGKKMSQFPLDPPLSKMMIMAQGLQCVDQVVTVVSMLSVPEVFYRPAERAEESDLAREKFFVPESDHLTLLNVYNLCVKHHFSAQWCGKHFLHVKAILKAKEVRDQLLDLCVVEKSPLLHSWDMVRKAICSSYFVHAAKLKNLTQYVNLLNGTPANLHPSSAICGIGETPVYVVYHELVLTSREYMRTVTAIDPLWLAELGPMFFSTSRKKNVVVPSSFQMNPIIKSTPDIKETIQTKGIIKKKNKRKFGL